MKSLLCTLVLLASSLDQRPYNRTIRAETLISEYNRNPVAADERYKGQGYAVGGTVYKVENAENVYVVLAGPNNCEDVCWVKCVFDNTAGLANLKKGSPVAIRGIIDGKRGYYVLMIKCKL